MIIRPARRVRGQMSVPGDKSISHRAAIMAALADGSARLSNYSTSADCASTLECLRRLGVEVERDGNEVRVRGVGLKGLRPTIEPLDCGNSGSTMRMLAGALAGQDFVSVLTGDQSLSSRPMRRIVEPLELMGARVSSVDGHAPLSITGSNQLRAISYRMPVASAQVKSCIMLAGLNARGRTQIIEPPEQQTRDHTERMLRWFGVTVEESEVVEGGARRKSVSVEGRTQFDADDGIIPGDISSAAFFIAAAALLPSSQLEISRVGLNPTRRGIVSVMRGLGVDVRLNRADSSGTAEDFNEPFGDIHVKGGADLTPVEEGRSNVLRGMLIPQLIDELPVLAVLGTQVTGGFSFRDAAELRVKESDRIVATVENLRAMGVEVEEHRDGLTIKRRTRLRGARINSHGDHRIAMAFSIAALIAEGETEIVGADCVSVSFPEFFQTLESVVER